MRKVVSLFVLMVTLTLPLITFAATQSKFDWQGGPKILGWIGSEPDTSLDEIAAKAAYQAAFYGSPVMYKTEDGSMIVEARPDLSKFPCESVYVEARNHAKLVMSTTKVFCDVSYEVSMTE